MPSVRAVNRIRGQRVAGQFTMGCYRCKGSTMVEDWTGEGGGTGNERETFIESSDKK